MSGKQCKICGRTIQPNSKGCVRANAAYCSDKCRRKALSISSTRSICKRLKTDEEFRKKRYLSSKLYTRKKREEERDKRYRGIASKIIENVSNGGDESSVADILKSEFVRKRKPKDA